MGFGLAANEHENSFVKGFRTMGADGFAKLPVLALELCTTNVTTPTGGKGLLARSIYTDRDPEVFFLGHSVGQNVNDVHPIGATFTAFQRLGHHGRAILP